MFNILISVAVSAVVTLLFGYIFGAPSISFWGGFLPGLITLLGTFFYLSRKIGKKLEALMMAVQVELQRGNPAKPDRDKFKRAIAVLEEGYAYAKWQVFTKAQIDGQIGMLYFLNKQFEEAKPYLENGFKRNWISRAMLAVIHYKRKQHAEMKVVFEELTKVSKKESLLWNLYAWCLWKAGSRDDAIDVLSRASEVLPDDDRITNNLLALQKKKKMKMRGWKEAWYQFHLDKPPQPKMQMDRRGVYRGR